MGWKGGIVIPEECFTTLRFLFHSSQDLMEFTIMIYLSINFILFLMELFLLLWVIKTDTNCHKLLSVNVAHLLFRQEFPSFIH